MLVDYEGGRYEHYRISDEDLKTLKNKKVRQFYEKQNGILDMFKEGSSHLTLLITIVSSTTRCSGLVDA